MQALWVPTKHMVRVLCDPNRQMMDFSTNRHNDDNDDTMLVKDQHSRSLQTFIDGLENNFRGEEKACTDRTSEASLHTLITVSDSHLQMYE